MLRVRGLCRQFLGPLDLDVELGSCLAIMGASGSGKSMLLRALADLDPNDGTVELDGVNRDALPAPEWRKRMRYGAAESGWWADTVGAHFTDVEAARPLASAIDLPGDVFSWPVTRLSTGEKQRLALLRLLTLPAPPETACVYLLDEPTSGLDAATTAQVETLLRNTLSPHTALIVVTHDSRQAHRLANRTLLLRDGHLTPTAPPSAAAPHALHRGTP